MAARTSASKKAPAQKKTNTGDTLAPITIAPPAVGRFELIDGEPRWLVPVTAIAIDPANANIHPERSIEEIRGSLRRFGQKKPIVLRPDFVINAGNGTYLAAIAESWTEVWVTQGGLEAYEAIGYGMADNRTADHSRLDDEIVEAYLRDMQKNDISLSGLGWDEIDLAQILATNSGPQANPSMQDLMQGMPEYEQQTIPVHQAILVRFDRAEDVTEFARRLELPITAQTRSTWFPYKAQESMLEYSVEDEDDLEAISDEGDDDEGEGDES